MSESDNRNLGRDSLFVLASIRIDGQEPEYRIKVRNLSAGGMMGEGPVRVERGAIVDVEIRNIGWIEGSVAWVQDNRFGIAFSEEIDPRLARAPVGVKGDEGHSPRFTRPIIAKRETGTLRKI